MKITQEVRDYAQKGMAEMSEAFIAGGAEVYIPAIESHTAEAAE
jgi:phosphomethylpyrimidine synthase